MWRVTVEFDVIAGQRDSVIAEATGVLEDLIAHPDVIACSAKVSDEPVEDELAP